MKIVGNSGKRVSYPNSSKSLLKKMLIKNTVLVLLEYFEMLNPLVCMTSNLIFVL